MSVEIKLKSSGKSAGKYEKWPFIVMDEPAKQQKKKKKLYL